MSLPEAWVRPELIHPQEFPCRVEMVPQGRTADIIQGADSGFYVFGDNS